MSSSVWDKIGEVIELVHAFYSIAHGDLETHFIT